MKISTILDKIDDNQLFVPAFQREYVWKRDDAKQLMDSLIKSYPTGTMLTWETRQPPELKGDVEYDERQGEVRILLDGQQRITTLYMLIKGTVPPYYSEKEIMHDTRNLYVNVETLELSYFSKTRMENDPLWCNLTDIFQRKIRSKDIMRALEEKGIEVDRAYDDQIDDNVRAIESILDRDFPEQTIPINASIREAIDIFYKVNASGVSLTDAELALAQVSGYWPQARDAFKRKLQQLAAGGFVFKLDFIVYVMLGCLHNVGSDMRKLHGVDNDKHIRQTWQKLDTIVLDYVMNIMRTHAYIDHTDEINSVYALVPIIVYCFHKEDTHFSDTEIRKIVKWFYYSQIRTRYVSQLPQKLDFDLRIVVESANPFDELLNVIAEERRLEISPDEFVGRSVSHPLFSLMRCYFKSRGAVCFTTGVGLRQNMGEKYQLEKDHIFPYSRLKKAGYGQGNRLKYALSREFTNRAILTQSANRKKSASTAYTYLTMVKAEHPQALELQCVPENESLWDISNYEAFLVERRRTIAQHLNVFLASFSATSSDTSAAVSLEELVMQGESDELEFKSSLRWDYQDGCVNKKLEDVVIKTVAAFANADGGTLLLGVDDAGEVLGLENDYSSLKGDKDRFELHLRGLFNRHFGTGFVSSKVKTLFPELQGMEVCQVDILAASEPMIITTKNNNGQQIERFYVRNGNSSQEIPLSQTNAYFKERFS